jgi:DHA1 family multidrug resistance protein-like MFS transporter
VTSAAFFGYAGFTLFLPVLPSFMQQLGASGVRQIAIWSGLSLGVTSIVSAMLSPFWGRVADRVGRKIVLIRAFAGCAIVMALVPLARHPWQVFALRAAQGLFTGYGGLAMAMAAETAPPGKLSSSIGIVQTAQRLAPSVGPVIGGLIAAAGGVRLTFMVSAGLYALAMVIIATLYHERPSAAAETPTKDSGLPLRKALELPNFLVLLVMIGGLQYIDRSIGPILPLYVVRLGTSSDQAPTVAGLLFSVMACTAALGHHLSGRALNRWPPRIVMAWGGSLVAAAALAMAAVPSVLSFGAAAGLFGLAVGMTMTAAYTGAGLVVPAGAHGTVFGLLASSSLMGIALGPAVSGAIGAIDMRLVFVVDVAVVAAITAAVLRSMPPHRT